MDEAKVPQAAIVRSADAALPYRCGRLRPRGNNRGEAEFILRALKAFQHIKTETIRTMRTGTTHFGLGRTKFAKWTKIVGDGH